MHHAAYQINFSSATPFLANLAWRHEANNASLAVDRNGLHCTDAAVADHFRQEMHAWYNPRAAADTTQLPPQFGYRTFNLRTFPRDISPSYHYSNLKKNLVALSLMLTINWSAIASFLKRFILIASGNYVRGTSRGGGCPDPQTLSFAGLSSVAELASRFVPSIYLLPFIQLSQRRLWQTVTTLA